MRILIAAVAVLLATPALAGVVERRGALESKDNVAKDCHRTITLARAEAGLPALKPGPTGEEPLLIAAVEMRVNGCPVLVMANDRRDMRPMPKANDGPAKLRPAENR